MWGMLESVDQFIQTTIGNVPLAVLTIALLATPTILYLIYRLSVPVASHGRPRKSATPVAQWVCPQCHSVNDLSTGRCYRCAFVVDDTIDILVIDPVTAKPIPLATPPATFPMDRPAVAVGPGHAAPVATPAMTSTATAPIAPAAPPVAPTTTPGAPGSPGVPVGPGRPVGAPVRSATGGSSIGTAVGARRPFDPPPAPPADQGGPSGA